MTEHDRPQQEPFRLPKSGWIELHPEIFPPYSLGRTKFPEDLAGRYRPVALFDQEYHPGQDAQRVLDRHSVTLETIRDVLRFIPADVDIGGSTRGSEDTRRVLQGSAAATLENLVVLPHVRVRNALIVSSTRRVIPLEEEAPLVEAVEDILGFVPEKDMRDILIARFGLITGQPVMLETLAAIHAKDPELDSPYKVRVAEQKTILALRQTKEVREILQSFR